MKLKRNTIKFIASSVTAILILVYCNDSFAQRRPTNLEVDTAISLEANPRLKAAAQRQRAILAERAAVNAPEDERDLWRIRTIAELIPSSTAPNVSATLRDAINDFKTRHNRSIRINDVRLVELMSLGAQRKEFGKRVAAYESALTTFSAPSTEARKQLLPAMIDTYQAVDKERMVELCEKYIEEFPNDTWFKPAAEFRLAWESKNETSMTQILNDWADKTTPEYLGAVGLAALHFRYSSITPITTPDPNPDTTPTQVVTPIGLLEEQAKAKLEDDRDKANALLDEIIHDLSVDCDWIDGAFLRAKAYLDYWPSRPEEALLECLDFLNRNPNDETIHFIECTLWAARILSRDPDAFAVAESLLNSFEAQTWWRLKETGMPKSEVESSIRSIRRSIKQ